MIRHVRFSLALTCLLLTNIGVAAAVSGALAQTAAERPPRPIDERLKIELFAEQPQIVTPTGIDVDHAGRVWAIESNTHFRPDDYKGHPSDRVLVMQDTDGDGHRPKVGRADRITVFTDGLTHTMSIAVKPVWLDQAAAQARERNKTVARASRWLDVYIATRRDIWLFSDDDGDLKADRKKRIIQLDTRGDYPHNGLAGFAFDAMGWMYFGFGENLGADYKIIGSDGTTLSGGGEGGNLYRCRPDGTKLQHWATGFWNPHASCVDAFGRLFTVDNDPDSRPPCRLLHVIEGGDYGFRFRNGRKGLHPFTAWNGEIPGTLPMVSGTGEAPSGIVAYESDGLPEDYIGNLLVTSWGDHRIDRFRLKPRGASFESIPETIIQGGEDFRPVGLAVAPDGSLYLTDWVKRDYHLHGHGRVWRVSMKEDSHREVIDILRITPDRSLKELEEHWKSPRLEVRRMAAQMIAAKHRNAGTQWHIPLRLFFSSLEEKRRQVSEWGAAWQNRNLQDRLGEKVIGWSRIPFTANNLRRLMATADDPHHLASGLRILGMDKVPSETLVEEFLNARAVDDLDVPSEKQVERIRLACLLGGRRVYPKDLHLPKTALTVESTSLRRVAVQWVAEENLKELRPHVEAVLDGETMTSDLFLATLAALEMLDGKDPRDFDKTPAGKYVLPMVRDEDRSPAVRAQALRLVDANDSALDAALMADLVRSTDPQLKREAVRTLAHSTREHAGPLLRAVAADENADVHLRAEAVVGLGAGLSESGSMPLAAETRELLLALLTGDNAVLRSEALRSLRAAVKTDDGVKAAIEKLAKTPDGSRGALAEEIALAVSGKATGGLRPPLAEETLNETLAGGDANAGRRVFFHTQSAGCFKCHTVNGRGGNIGPDLSRVGRALNRKRLAESILEPSKEIAPQFTNWTFVMASGKVHTGMILGDTRDNVQQIGTADGEIVELPANEIEFRRPQQKSLMPEKLAERMTAGELRDLLAFLKSLK